VGDGFCLIGGVYGGILVGFIFWGGGGVGVGGGGLDGGGGGVCEGGGL